MGETGLKHLILERHSRDNTSTVIALIGANKQLFAELISYLFSKDKRVAQRAAWIASEVCTIRPDLLKPHAKDIITNLAGKNVDSGVKRNSLRIFQHVPVPPSQHGTMMNICFQIITSNSEPPAVKANALTILDHLRERYPDIRDELKTVIESGMETESPAFKSRAAKILKKLKKI
ncbi:hypothetical protein ACX0G7_01055 [Flavitalea antarctica]